MDPRRKHKILREKYEQHAPEISNWWNELLDAMEFDAKVPPHKKFSVLRKVFPEHILKHIMSIMSVERKKCKRESSVKAPPRYNSTVRKPRFGSDASVGTTFDNDEISLNAKCLDSPSKDSSLVKQDAAPHPDEKAFAYINFFKRRPDRAAIWRALPPRRLEDMNLIEKAEAITKAIATDFVSWVKTLNGDAESTLIVSEVMEMFEIAVQINSATYLCVKFKEMPTVPQQVANSLNLPHMSKREMLYREIMRDHRAGRRKCQIVAFGRTLPTDMQIKPPKENVKKKWLGCDKVPHRLQTMAAVWQGITHLKSTGAYCAFLSNNKHDLTPPKYLVDSGMMDPATIILTEEAGRQRHESFGNVSNAVSYSSRNVSYNDSSIL